MAIFVINLFVMMWVYVRFYVMDAKYSQEIIQSSFGCLSVLIIWFYYRVTSQMKKKHFYEYNRVKKQLFKYLLVVIFVLIMFFTFTTIEGATFESNYFFWTVAFCNNKQIFFIRVKLALKFICQVIQLEELALLSNIILLKSVKDLLQGLNKLDVLLKVSVF